MPLNSQMFDFLHVYIPVIIVVGIVGNVMSAAVFLCTRLRRRSSSYYLAAMAASDTTFLLVLLLLHLDLFTAASLTFLVSAPACKIINYFGSITTSISVWLTVAYTLERCIAVQYPLRRSSLCTVGRAKTTICAVVLFTAATYLHLLLTHGAPQDFNGCGFYAEYKYVVNVLNYVDIVAMVFLPFVLIVIMNSLIVWRLWNFSRMFHTAADASTGSSRAVCGGSEGTPLSPLLPTSRPPPSHPLQHLTDTAANEALNLGSESTRPTSLLPNSPKSTDYASICSQFITRKSNSTKCKPDNTASKPASPATCSPACSLDVDRCMTGSSARHVFTDLSHQNDQFVSQFNSSHTDQAGNSLESQVNVSLSSQVNDSASSAVVPQASTGQAKVSGSTSDSQSPTSQVRDSSVHPNLLLLSTQDTESSPEEIKDTFHLSTTQVSDSTGDTSTTHFTTLSPGPIKTDSKTQVTAASPVSLKFVDPVMGKRPACATVVCLDNTHTGGSCPCSPVMDHKTNRGAVTAYDDKTRETADRIIDGTQSFTENPTTAADGADDTSEVCVDSTRGRGHDDKRIYLRTKILINTTQHTYPTSTAHANTSKRHSHNTVKYNTKPTHDKLHIYFSKSCGQSLPREQVQYNSRNRYPSARKTTLGSTKKQVRVVSRSRSLTTTNHTLAINENHTWSTGRNHRHASRGKRQNTRSGQGWYTRNLSHTLTTTTNQTRHSTRFTHITNKNPQAGRGNHQRHFVTVKHSQMMTRDQHQYTTRTTSQGSRDKIQSSREHRAHNNISKMLILISTMFIVLQLPSSCLRLYMMLGFQREVVQPGEETRDLSNTQHIFMCLYYLHYSINFLLYTICGSNFRQSLRQLILSKVKQLVNWSCHKGSCEHL